MWEILHRVPETALAGVSSTGELVRSATTPWIGARLFRSNRDGMGLQWSPKPIFGMENVRPRLPGSEERTFERHGLPSRVYPHLLIDGQELRARRATEGMELDEGVRDLHIRFALTKNIIEALGKYSKYLAGVTYESTSTTIDVDFVN